MLQLTCFNCIQLNLINLLAQNFTNETNVNYSNHFVGPLACDHSYNLVYDIKFHKLLMFMYRPLSYLPVLIAAHAKSDSEPTIDQLVEEFGTETSVTDWQMIALQLDMDQQCVETFERDEEKGIKECFRKVFTKWKKQLKPPFTWAVIVRALSSSVNEDQHKFADKLKMKYLPY